MDELLLTCNKDRVKIAACNKLVEEYICARQLIVYGGTAIDFAMRKNGRPPIYSDAVLDFTDYDVYTPRVLEDAHALATEISSHFASKDVAIINAIHIRTLKIQFLGIWVADLSYAPEEIYERMPTETYRTHRGNDLLFISPSVQCADIHASLSEPYVDPPREVYLHRAVKDIARYNLLQPYIADPDWSVLDDCSQQTVKASLPHAHMLMVGLGAAFKLLDLAADAGYKRRVKGTIEIVGVDVTLKYRGPLWPVEAVSDRPLAASGSAQTYRRLLDFLPKSLRGETLIVYQADKSLYPCFLDSASVYYSCVQSALKLSIIHAWYTVGDTKAKKTKLTDTIQHRFFMCVYWDLIGALGFMEKLAKDTAALAPWLLGTTVWPSPSAPNESNALINSRMMTLANIEDRRTGMMGTDGAAIKRILGLRPPNVYFSSKGFEMRAKEFLEWGDHMSGIFNASGEPEPKKRE